MFVKGIRIILRLGVKLMRAAVSGIRTYTARFPAASASCRRLTCMLAGGIR
jgi:hypothetical protein